MERYNDYYGMIPKGLAGFKVMAELWKLGEKIVGKISKTFGKNTNAASKTKVGYGLRHLPKRALATAGTIAAAGALDAAALDNASDQESNPSLFWPLASTAMLVGSVLYPNLYMRYGKSGALKGLVGMPKTAKEWVEKNGGVGYLPSGQLNPFKLGFRLENPTNIMSDLNLQAKAYGRIGFYEKELANFNKAAFASDKSQKVMFDEINKKIKDYNSSVKKLNEEMSKYLTQRDNLHNLYVDNDFNYPEGWTQDQIDMHDNYYPKGWTSGLIQAYDIGEIQPYSSIDEYANELRNASDHIFESGAQKRLNFIFGENPATLSVSKQPTSADTRGALWRNFLRILDWVGPIVFGTTTVASWLNYGHSGSGSKENNKQSEDSDSTSIAAEAKKTPVLNPNSTVGQSTTPISNDGIIFNGYPIINQLLVYDNNNSK